MDNKIRDLLEEEIKTELEDLSSLTTGSKEKSIAIEDLEKLYKLRIEDIKAEMDHNEKSEQLKEDVKNRYLRIGLEAAGIVLPLVFYSTWMKKGFKFEETGTFTSTTFRGLFNRFRPTIK